MNYFLHQTNFPRYSVSKAKISWKTIIAHRHFFPLPKCAFTLNCILTAYIIINPWWSTNGHREEWKILGCPQAVSSNSSCHRPPTKIGPWNTSRKRNKDITDASISVCVCLCLIWACWIYKQQGTNHSDIQVWSEWFYPRDPLEVIPLLGMMLIFLIWFHNNMRKVCTVGIITFFCLWRSDMLNDRLSRPIADEENDTEILILWPLLLLLLSAAMCPVFFLCQDMRFRNVMSLNPFSGPLGRYCVIVQNPVSSAVVSFQS